MRANDLAHDDEREQACIDVHSPVFPLGVLDVLRREGARYRTPVRTEPDGRLFVVTRNS